MCFCSNSSLVKCHHHIKGHETCVGMFIHKRYYRRQEPTTIVLWEGHLTDKSHDRVRHLNTILARGGGNFNDTIFKSSNALGLLWEGEGGGTKGGDVEVSS